jgi:sortase A
VLSLLLVAGGAVLLVLGGRDLWESFSGQRKAEREWKTAAPPARPRPRPVPAPAYGTTFAKLSIPRLGKAWYVYEGANKKNLRLGPAHLYGTPMPGMPGNCIIAGHRDTHFRALKDIRTGDEILVETQTGIHRYTVRRTRIVKPTNKDPLRQTPEPVMNLITCYPFYYAGNAPKRFIVETELKVAEVANGSLATAAQTQ